MLKTEQNTQAMQKRVLSAGRKCFGRAAIQSAGFEHGQWWLFLKDGSSWSVCDAIGGSNTYDGFCFEQVSAATEN